VEQLRVGVHYPRSTGEFQAWFRTDEDCLDYLELAGSGARAARGVSRARCPPSGLCWSAYCTDSVRGCPRHPAAGSPRARTYGGQRRCGKPYPMLFAQFRGHVEVQAGAGCKPSGQPTLVRTQYLPPNFRRSKPVTLDCVTGFSREKERLHEPSAPPRPCPLYVREPVLLSRAQPTVTGPGQPARPSTGTHRY
jgi:hypothetical protein